MDSITKASKGNLPSYFDEGLTKLRKEVRNLFRTSYENGDWASYKNLLNEYNKTRKKRLPKLLSG